jgi:outer membrane protein, heavy metal efflux system
MRTGSGLGRWLPVGALVFGGCASTFSGPDLDRVRALSRTAELPGISTVDVDAAPSAEAERLAREPLDVERAVRIALLNNRELRGVLRDMGIARGRYVQAGLLPNPHVEAEKPLEPEMLYEVGVEYDVTAALLAPMRARAAAADVEAARYRAAAAVVDLGFAVRAAFHAAQAAEQKLAIARRTLDALAAGRDAARALLDAGNVPALVHASQEAAYERARVAVAQLELANASSREGLNRLLGLHGAATTWRLAGGLPRAPEAQPDTAKLEQKAVEASLALGEMRNRLEGLSRRTGLARAEGWIPEVAAGVRTGELEHEGMPHRHRQWGAGVSISIPLFDRQQGNVHALGAEFDALMERYQGAAVDVRSAARDAANRVLNAHARARQYEMVIVPAQRRATEQTILQFNAMQVGVFQLLAARREELDVEMAYVDSLAEYWTARAAVDAITAGGRAGASAAAAVQMTAQTESAGGH